MKPGVAEAAGLVAPGAVYSGGSTAQRKLNSLRPYVGYSQIVQIAPIFDSNYNSLQSQLIKRFSGGNTVTGTYTWSHGMTDNQTDRSTGLLYTYCKRCEYGRSQLDRRNVGTINYVYNLPFLREQGGFIGRVLGGWELSGILVANSGLPITPFELRGFGDVAAGGVSGPGAPNNGRAATPRPVQVSDPNSGAPHTQSEWFNTAAFVAPTTNDVRLTAHRGAINGPGFWRYDQSLMKNFKIYESLNLTFRAEAFNLFNHTNYNSVGATLGTSTFGQVLSVRDPRILQLSLKLQF
ncbi:MAG: hypothetical protein JOZ43_00295 [Acidobacteriales bacterium]|nr:hypothetical protein [Terriglobales bacterium]